MSYHLLTIVDWALIAGSIFNTIGLLWLGLMVLLNAERRTWGTWLAAGGLIFGGAFFVGHTAVVGRATSGFSNEMAFYWRTGWLVLIMAPYMWYVVMDWYSGRLRERSERLRLLGVSLLGGVALIMVLFVDPLSSYAELVRPDSASVEFLSRKNLTRLIYPAFAALCVVFAIQSLHRSSLVSERFMGDLARRRARPWLIATSIVLLLIIMLIGIGSIWFLDQVRIEIFPNLTMRGVGLLIGFDFVICMLIALLVVLIGQAVVAYEIFTGAALPRGELARQWRRIIILGGIYALIVGWSLSAAGIPRQPIYQLLLATLLMTFFLVLTGWRSARETTSGLARLRPFVASQNLYDQLLGPGGTGDSEPTEAFHALCGGLLGTRIGYLIPLGSLSDLAAPALAHPAGTPPDPNPIMSAFHASPGTQLPLCLPIDPGVYAGAGWAVPLRNDRGIIGLLLLGAKADGGIYTQEEIEVARAAGERIIDARAAAEMARRLATLQRRRLAESQILDRRTRRVLHDEVLPQIHASLLEIGGRTDLDLPLQSAITNLQSAHHMISDLLHDLPPAMGTDLARMGVLGALRRAIDTDLGGAFDHVRWNADPVVEDAARCLDPLAAEALYYAAREAVRNAARHGRGDTPGRRLALTVYATCASDRGGQQALAITIEDDGVGMGVAPPRDDGGHGLSLHSTMLAIMGGTLSVASTPRQPTRVTISMPLPAGGIMEV